MRRSNGIFTKTSLNLNSLKINARQLRIPVEKMSRDLLVATSHRGDAGPA